MSSRADLARYRLESAGESLQSAKRMLAAGYYKGATNRAYHCLFDSIRSVHALSGFDTKNHSEIIDEFRKQHIATGEFPAELAEIIGDAFMLRNKSDYGDFYIADKEEVARQVSDAEVFYNAVAEKLSTKIQVELASVEKERAALADDIKVAESATKGGQTRISHGQERGTTR